MNRDEIITVLRELHKVTGFRVSLHGNDYREIAAYPEQSRPFCVFINNEPSEHEKCLACDRAACNQALADRKTYIYQCRHGLIEAVSPLYNFGMLTGFLMMGQVVGNAADREKIYKTMHRLCRDRDRARATADCIPVLPEDMVESYARIMTICAQYITLSNALPSKRTTVAELAKKYIYEHYHKKINIKDICASIGCSKSTLTTSFKRESGQTVNEYIISVRLDAAKALLKGNEKNISEIALLTGFSDQAYFSKVFSARYGISPSQYRNGLPFGNKRNASQ